MKMLISVILLFHLHILLINFLLGRDQIWKVGAKELCNLRDKKKL